MKLVALPCGKQRCIHGPAVNVLTDLSNLCAMLPRLPSQLALVSIKLKRKLTYKGHYLYDYVSPNKLFEALLWLKQYNVMYINFEINDHWNTQCLHDDRELYDVLIGNDSKSTNDCEMYDNHINGETVTGEHYDCTLAQCANSAENINVFMTQHLANFDSLANNNGYMVVDVPADRNCFFSSVAQ